MYEYEVTVGLPQAVAVLRKVGQKYRLTQDMKEAAAALNLTLASHAITLPQIYADAPGQGQVIIDMGNKASQASYEFALLFAEIFSEHKIIKNPKAGGVVCVVNLLSSWCRLRRNSDRLGVVCVVF